MSSRWKIRARCFAATFCVLPMLLHGAVVYDNQSSFTAQLVPGYFFNDFSELGEGTVASGLSQSGNGYSYTISTHDDTALYAIGSSAAQRALSTDSVQRTIIINFTSGNVTAVGGNFFLTDFGGVQQPGALTLTLSDSTTEEVSSGSTPFRGFTTSGGTYITSLSFQPSGNWATMDNLYVGQAVPEASTTIAAALLVVFVAGQMIIRRRRSKAVLADAK
jgi:hypothetical protein